MGHRCPACGVTISGERSLDVTPHAKPRPPRARDVAVCPACGSASLIAHDGHLELLDEAQLQQLEPDVLAALRAVQRQVRGEVH